MPIQSLTEEIEDHFGLEQDKRILGCPNVFWVVDFPLFQAILLLPH
jgi:hypothetical protein